MDKSRKNIPENRNMAYLAALAYAFTIGFSFLFLKIGLRYASPIDILAHRLMISALLALLPFLCGWAKFTATQRQIVSILPIALFYPVLFFILQTFGIVYIKSSEAGMLQATAPIFTLILGLLILKERSNCRQLLSVLLSVGGVIFVSLMGDKGVGRNANTALGVTLTLCSALSMAFYVVLARKYVQRFSVSALTLVMSLIGFAAFMALAATTNAVAGTMERMFTPLTHWPYIMSILFLGGASSFLSSFCSNYALTKLEASKMVIFANLATLIAVVAGAVFLDEPLYWYHIVGGCAIVLGVLGTNYFKKN